VGPSACCPQSAPVLGRTPQDQLDAMRPATPVCYLWPRPQHHGRRTGDDLHYPAAALTVKAEFGRILRQRLSSPGAPGGNPAEL